MTVDRRVSNFDQFFSGLPISLSEQPHPTSVGPPRLAEDGSVRAGVSLPTRAKQRAEAPAARSGWRLILHDGVNRRKQ